MTTKTNHTPGPWICDERNEPTGSISVYANGPIVYVSDNGNGPENQMANAQLIASAPDLLATLKQVLAILNQPWKDCEFATTLDIAIAACSIARTQIKCAIERAEGRAK